MVSDPFENAYDAGAKAGLVRLITIVISKLVPLVIPWIVTFALLPLAAAGTHARWGASPWAAAALTMSTVALTCVTWLTARRGPIGRIHTTVSTLGSMTWLTVATITGPTADLTLDLLLWAGGSNALAWSLRRLVHRDDDGPGAVTPGVWARIAERVGLKGSRLSVTNERPNVVQGQLQLDGGKQTPRDVANRRDAIAGALQIPPNGVRVSEDPDRGDRANVSFTTKDVLRDLIPWQGPAAAGQSLTAAPITYGLHEDGLPAELALVRPDGTQIHLLICGMTGAGKSETARVCVADSITRVDVVLWAIDTRKKLQTFGKGGLYTGLDWFATDTRTANAMLRALNKVIPGRAEALGRYGYDKWTPAAYTDPRLRMPYLLVWIEEAAALTSQGDGVFEQLLETARSAGVGLVVSLQRASYDRISTTARGQFGAALCYGVNDRTDAEFVLGDLVLQGADPSPWSNKKPGYAFATIGNDKGRYVIPLRGTIADADQLTAAVDVRRQILAAGHGRLDTLTADLAGKPYATRTAPETSSGPDDTDDTGGPVSAAQAPEAPQRTPAALQQPLTDTPAPQDTSDDVDQDDDVDEQSVADAREDAMNDPALAEAAEGIRRLETAANADSDQGISGDITTTIEPATGTWELGQPDAQISPEAARDTVIARIDEWDAEGRSSFAPRDLADLVAEAGRSRTWIYQVLTELEDDGRIARDGVGTYRIHPRALTATLTRD